MSKSDKIKKYVGYFELIKLVIKLFKARKQGATIDEIIEIVKEEDVDIDDLKEDIMGD